MEQTGISTEPPLETEKQAELGVQLGTIDQVRPKVSLRLRNPFRLGGSSSPAPLVRNPALPSGNGEQALTASSVAEIVPGVRLRMIGLVDGPGTGERIAVLTDGDVVFHGREGEILEGRYRIVDFGSTWVEVESMDDGSRQTLRLTGP
jgi:hypothetical protein